MSLSPVSNLIKQFLGQFDWVSEKVVSPHSKFKSQILLIEGLVLKGCRKYRYFRHFAVGGVKGGFAKYLKFATVWLLHLPVALLYFPTDTLPN